MERKGSKTIISVFFPIRLWLEFLLALCQIVAIPIRVLHNDIVHNTIVYLPHILVRQQGISVVEASHRRTWWVVLVYHKVILIYHKQHIISYRIKEAVKLKSLPLKIGPDIDLVCPSISLLTNIVIESGCMGVIRWPCSIWRGGAKLLCARLCSFRLFWHPACTKIRR